MPQTNLVFIHLISSVLLKMIPLKITCIFRVFELIKLNFMIMRGVFISPIKVRKNFARFKKDVFSVQKVITFILYQHFFIYDNCIPYYLVMMICF